MPISKSLTTEHIRSLFQNNFKLSNYAIRMAQFYIKAGHEVSASAILKEVAKHPDESYLETLQELEKADEAENQYEDS